MRLEVSYDVSGARTTRLSVASGYLVRSAPRTKITRRYIGSGIATTGILIVVTLHKASRLGMVLLWRGYGASAARRRSKSRSTVRAAGVVDVLLLL